MMFSFKWDESRYLYAVMDEDGYVVSEHINAEDAEMETKELNGEL